MKKIRRLIAVLLSVIMVAAIVPFSVFAESIPEELICDYGDGDYGIYHYISELELGENSFPEVDFELNHFCSFVPGKTGVYSFSGGFEGITSDTNDDECSMDDFEETMMFFDQDWETGEDYVFLTEGTMYFVLFSFLDDFRISYAGQVEDVEPVLPLNDLVEDWDIIIDENSAELDAELKITFSNKVAYTSWSCFEEGYYTANNLIWSHLGFEKILRYSTINVYDMIEYVEVKERIALVRYFDGTIELKKPAVLELNFTNGKTVELSIENYDYVYEFTGTNGRQYSAGLSILDDDSLRISVAGAEFESSNYTLKRVGFFKDLAYYLLCKSSIRAYYSSIMKGEDLNTRLKLMFERSGELGALRTEFWKSVLTK